MTQQPKGRVQRLMVGFRPEVRARQGVMLGIRQPLDGPVFEKLEDARNWCVYAMIDHYDRRLGMSDARIEPFKGLVDCGPPQDPALVRDVERICEQVARESNGDPSLPKRLIQPGD
jgi:hypothetical protein